MIESTHVVKKTLSDGSKVFDVTIHDDRDNKPLARLCMACEADAIEIANLIQSKAVGIEEIE